MSDLKEIVLMILIHDLRHPNHGVDCACMDGWIGKIRSMTSVALGTKAQQRVDYVLRAAVDNRLPKDNLETDND